MLIPCTKKKKVFFLILIYKSVCVHCTHPPSPPRRFTLKEESWFKERAHNCIVRKSCMTHRAAAKTWVVPPQHRVATLNGRPWAPHLIETCVALEANHLRNRRHLFQTKHHRGKPSAGQNTLVSNNTSPKHRCVTHNTLVLEHHITHANQLCDTEYLCFKQYITKANSLQHRTHLSSRDTLTKHTISNTEHTFFEAPHR